jgi:hypothetical protein
MTQLGLTAKAVNAVTKGEAEKEGKNIWALVELETNVILVSPEMLSTPGFTSLIASKKFQDRLFAIAIDELHLLTSWGESFRPMYKQIMYVRARFAKRVVTFGMTATLWVGKHLQSVCSFFGWKDGTFKLLRRSMQDQMCNLSFEHLTRLQEVSGFHNSTGCSTKKVKP